MALGSRTTENWVSVNKMGVCQDVWLIRKGGDDDDDSEVGVFGHGIAEHR